MHNVFFHTIMTENGYEVVDRNYMINAGYEYNPNATYRVGDCIYHNDLMYRCVYDIPEPKPWNELDWIPMNFTDEFSALHHQAESIRTVFSEVYDPHKPYAVNSYCVYENKLYQCIVDTAPEGEEWDASHWKSIYLTDVATTSDSFVISAEAYAQLKTDGVIVENREYYVAL